MDINKPLSPFQKYNCIALGYHLMFFHPLFASLKVRNTFLNDAWIIEFLKEKMRKDLSSPLLDSIFKIQKYTL